jgi:hypothetical protein
MKRYKNSGDENTLVVATLGSEPIAEYSAIVVLDGQFSLRTG